MSGCALQQEQVEQQLQSPAPIHCATAAGDLRVLESEKANVAERLAEGVTAVFPAGAVVGTITGVEDTKVAVSTGEYNQAIDARIAAIKAKCGIR